MELAVLTSGFIKAPQTSGIYLFQILQVSVMRVVAIFQGTIITFQLTTKGRSGRLQGMNLLA
jgi:hypothetical protein